MQFIPSPEQQAIFDYVLGNINKEGRKALAIDAKAGTGKTTSILELIKLLAAEGHDVKGVYCAFNKDIVTEVQPKLADTNVTAKTFHSLSMGSLLKHLKKKFHTQIPKEFVDANKYRDLINSFIEQTPDMAVMFDDAASFDDDTSPADVRKVFVYGAMQLCHFIRVRLEAWDDHEKLNWIITDYGLDDPVLTPELLDVMVNMQRTILSQGEELLKKTALMDFDDMIYWVCKWDVRLWSNKWVFVDEAQDLSPMQRTIVSKVVDHRNGFVIIVGDPNQAIYRFAGADSDSFSRTVNWFKADVLPLTVTRRCDKIITHHAAELVPEFTALETKERGKVVWLDEKDFADNARPGDMVICRVKAPLIGKAIEVIANEMPAVILGGNIGTALIDTMETISKRDGFRWIDPIKAVESYQFVRVRHFLQKEDEAAADTARDDCQAIKVLLENSKATSLKMFSDYVNDLFSDKDGAGKVIFCTAHKSKGLEASRVFFLKPEKMPLIYPNMHPESIQQEKNLKYVLLTRAENELVYLTNADFMKPYSAGKEIPSFIQYDFETHRWTEDGLYLLDDNDMTAIQLPSGSLQAKARPEDAQFAKELVDTNKVPAGSVLTFDKESGDLMEITVVDNEPVATPTIEIEKIIEEKPLTMADAANKLYEPEPLNISDAVTEEVIILDELKEETAGDSDISPADEKLPELDIPSSPVEWAKFVLEHKDRFVVLDTETTTWAKDKANCEVIQLAIIDMEGNALFNQRIKPHQAKISDGASAVHGITDDMLSDEKTIENYLPYIRDAIEGKYVIAYNVSFDEKALENAFYHAKIEAVETAGWQCAMLKYANHNDNKYSYGRRGGWWKLTEAMQQQRLTARDDAHDALADVIMTLDLIKSMAEDEPNRWQNKFGFKPGDVVNIKASNTRMEVIKTMPNGQVNMKAYDDESRHTMDASAIQLITPVEELPAFLRQPVVEDDPEPIEEPVTDEATPEPTIEPVEVEVVETTSNENPDIVIVEKPKKKIINVTPVPNTPHKKLEDLIALTGSRENALELVELLTSVIDEVYPV